MSTASERAGLVVGDLNVALDGRRVLSDLSWSLGASQLGVLLGPSGCGKTTLLRVIAGQVGAQPGGRVEVAGRDLTGVPAERRGIVLVSQTTRLFPHLDVARNIGYGLRVRGVAAATRRRRVADLLDLVGLPDLGARDPQTLSGGQAQRVALARALAIEPEVLLLDEPFAQLDPDTRSEMHNLVRSVQREVGTTTLCVTHDRQEALVLADTLAVMLRGTIVAAGVPADLMIRPPDPEVARFLGAVNAVAGHATDGRVSLPGVRADLRVEATGPGVLLLRPESVALRPAPDTEAVSASVHSSTYRGTHQEVLVDLPGGNRLVAHTDLGRTWVHGDRVVVDVLPEHGTWSPT